MRGPLDLGFAWPSEQSMTSIAFSSYSPLALRDMPQPRPNDAPSDIDTSVFTFEDAFEDLLAESQGKELPDIKSRYEQRKLLRSMYPDGEPAYFWLHRLRSQGLLEDSGPAKLVKSLANNNWDQLHEELDRRAQEVWRAAFGEDEKNDTLRETKREHALSSEERNEERSCWERENSAEYEIEDLRAELHGHRNLRRVPNDFDELFSAIQSSFASDRSPWDSFMKLITEDHPTAPSSSEDKQLQKPGSDEKQVVTKDEYVDRFGYLHTKTLVKTLDGNGNEIGSHSHYTVRPAPKDNEHAQIGDKDKDKDGQESGTKVDGTAKAKTGWLWK
ncbi:uncharacterized protein FOBCDRAFT_38141 [Fusarium oxysporum Fo47]|uniref:Uncharacterized protein n=1 Tax=Fusarium oxysporum Fo47 TaxID=660027 RepID=W9K272_FUSOX|nr:uncharacterized protein FOBCDRAFT_38141 [Fusarium oxysporum Fo47]EWZ38401.1 hypothetical protein FOZG_10023 [Fusarium oxysporum Fo47]QKD54988.1 hypothetical protein FOBCDRAFT_38141 [Fusarium oxysporum Fo47]